MRQRNVGVEKVLRYKIFTIESCIYCVRAKMLLNKHGVSFEEKHLKGDDINKFKQLTKLNTLPQIYDAEQNHIGGYAELCEHFN